jgi:hypothetical protein
MKHSFEHKNLGDKLLITLFVNGIKSGFTYKTLKNDVQSSYVNIKEAEEQLLLRHLIINEEQQGE